MSLKRRRTVILAMYSIPKKVAWIFAGMFALLYIQS